MTEYVTRAVLSKNRIYTSQVEDFQIFVDFDRETAPTAGQMLLVSLASCKLVSLLELRTKHKMDIEHAEIEVRGTTGKGDPIEGSRFPTSVFLSIDYVFKVRTEHTDEELQAFLKYVNGACTVGNTISSKVDQNYRFERI